MADKEKNTPIQEPENQENEVKDLNETPEVEAAAETEAQSSEEIPAEDASPEETVAEEAAEEPAAEGETVETEEIAEPVEETETVEETAPAAEEIEPEGEPEKVAADEAGDEVVEETVEETVDEAIGETVDEAVDEAVEETAEESEPTEDATEAADETVETDELDFEVGDDGEIAIRESEPEDYFEEDAEDIDPDDLVIHDEVISAIKAEGEKLENEEISLKAYIKHSKEAIKNFEAALKTGRQAMEANRDEKEVPAILAGIIKICGKILEVRCNNLENFVRVKAHEYIKIARTALHRDIDNYNDYVITYASITGEQLTRLSTFLPENIASGKSLAVVPELVYRESYVQVLPDAKLTREDEATTTVISPIVSAEDLLADVKAPKSKMGCSSYARKIRRRMKRLEEETVSLNKLLAETKAARKSYESELENLERRTSLADRTTEEYKNKVFQINIKYGKKLAGIETVKAANAFARKNLRLSVSRFALEREKLVLAYEYLRNVYRAGSYSQRKTAERYFSEVIKNYNKCAELCSRATGTEFTALPPAIIEQACRGDEIAFPTVAYKRELIEIVGATSKPISMVVKEDLLPDEEAFKDNSGRVLDANAKIKNTASLSEESAMVDRASAIAKVMIETLRESADLVISADEFEQFEVKSNKAIKYFKRALRGTEKAMADAFDENGVITALVENLRVIANLIEVRRINIAVAMRLNRKDQARGHGRALYKNIELYNGRAIDYMSIVGEQFSRITQSTAKDFMDTADKLKVPIITYKDNYIEVFPKDPLKDDTYEKPRLWRSGVYTPLLMQHYRLTENRSVETTVINSPFVFDVMTDEMPATTWWHPIGFVQHLFVWAQPIVAWWHRVCTNVEIWFVDESLLFSKSGLKGRQNRNEKKKSKFEIKLKRLNDEHTAKILALETVVHETDRHGAAYQKKLYKINAKFSRKVYRLKVRYMKDCTGRTAARLLLERLVLERERLAGINKVLLKYRNYGRITFTRNVLVKYKKRFIEAINAHNDTARKLSDMVGVKFAEVSTSVADEIVRYGNMIKFPEIICCREVIETVDGKQRTVGDRWHGYGLYTGTTGSKAGNANAPIMSVGAMGYATDMGVPFLKADFDGMTIMGMTPGGVPLIGFSQTGEASIPFTGTPMMLSGADTSVILDAGLADQDSLVLGAANSSDPYSGIHKRGADARYTEEAEDDAKDLNSGIEVETPLDLESKMIEERFVRALRARSMTTVDNVANWWKLVGSEINVRLMRWLTIKNRNFLNSLLPTKDEYREIVNEKVSAKDAALLRRIAKIGGIIDIECRRYYSAVKTGVRRSQRVWSSWLHDDIERYNDLVREFNKGKPRYMQLELLSLNIPDTIKYRKEDRPPVPPVLSLRNRVKLDKNKEPITTEEIVDKLVRYALGSAHRIDMYDDRKYKIRKDSPLEDVPPRINLLYAILSLPVRLIGAIFYGIRNLRLNWAVYRLRKLYNKDNKRLEARIERLRARGKYKKADRLEEKYLRNRNEKLLGRVSKIIGLRTARTYLRRQENENRHYRIRYEKARSMRRYNRRTLRAVGIANDPIKYQTKVHKALRRYLSRNFRIDYNMRIRQLIYRALRMNFSVYWIVILAIATVVAISAIFFPSYPALPVMVMVGLSWAVFPIVLDLIAVVYDFAMFIASVLLLVTRNIWLIRYGARDVERSRYGAVLDCFVNEQHRLLMDCAAVQLKPKSTNARKKLIATVNDYNKRAEIYSEILRVPIKPIETTALLDKLTSDVKCNLTELQDFVYVRELVERVDKHKRGKSLSERELGYLVEEINSIINSINLAGSDDQVAVDFLQSAMQKLISHVQTGIKLTQNERYELKRDLIQGIEQFAISPEHKEIFSRDVIKIVDQLGGRDSRRIISVLAEDDMII